MLKRWHYKKGIKLLAIGVISGITLATPAVIVVQNATSNSIFDARAVLYETFQNQELVDELHFCKSAYISNEQQIDPTKITIGFDTVSHKIISLEWRNASATIPTVDANFSNILDWFNTNRPLVGDKWAFKDENVLKNFFDNATSNRAKWSGKITWPGLDIPNNIFNSYYLSEHLYNWDAAEIQNGCSSIGNEAFHGVSTLSDVWFPSSLLQIGYLAFSSTGIQVCNLIGGQLSNIGDHAFYQCSSLTNIVIKTSSSLNLVIGDECFKYDGDVNGALPAETRDITLYAENIGELKKSCFAFKNVASSSNQNLSSFTFGYLKPLTTINKAATSPWLNTTATNVYAPQMYKDRNGDLNSWDSFFPVVSTIIPIDGVALSFATGYQDEILFDYTNGYDGTAPIISAYSLAENYAENLDINKLTIGLYACSDMNPPKKIKDEILISGVTFDKTTLSNGAIAFTIHIAPNVPYFAPSTGTRVSKAAWIGINYNNSQFVRYRHTYFYNDTVERATNADNVQMFLNGDPTTTTTVPVDLTNAIGDKTFTINTAWYVETTKSASINSNDTLTIDSSISTYPNIEYDQVQKRISFHPFCLPGTFTFQFTATIQSASSTTIVRTFSLAFSVSKTPDVITIHNDYNTFISGRLPSGTNDIRPSIYYLTTYPARCDRDANWEIVQNGTEPFPSGLFIKENSEQAKPTNFYDTQDAWEDVSPGQLWSDHNMAVTGTFTFKVKATVKNTAISSITEPQTITFVNANVNAPNIIKVDKRSYGDTDIGEATVSQDIESLLNIGFDYEPGFDYNLLKPYATLYDRDQAFPSGLSIVPNEGSDKIQYPYKIRANVTSPPGDYYITIGGRSSVFYSISVHEYTIVLHVLPKPTEPIVFPTTLIILFVITGLIVSVIAYFLIRKLIRKH